MASCLVERSPRLPTLAHRHPRLSRASTHDPSMIANTNRKRLLSEHNEDHIIRTLGVDSASKRIKKDLRPADSRGNNLHHTLPLCSFSFLERTRECRSSPGLLRRKSVIHHPSGYITHLSRSQSTTPLQLSSSTTTKTSSMLLCQQTPAAIVNNTDSERDDKDNDSKFITCAQLVACLTTVANCPNRSVLIIDCGSRFRHIERRIQDSFLLNVNDKLSRKRLATRGLKQFLQGDQSDRLTKCDTIILYDDHVRSSCSTAATQCQLSSSLKCVLDEVIRYDANKTVHILESPFDEFYQHYPQFCYVSTSTDDDQTEAAPVTATITAIDLDSCPMAEIVPGLYLGSARDAENLDLLKHHRISSIVNISTCIPCYHENEPTFDYLRLPCHDSCHENILEHFPTAFDFIHKTLTQNENNNQKNVLVHCQGGVSRSPSFVIGYLMRYHSMKFEQARIFVKTQRKVINPNLNFLAQLLRYEQLLQSTQ